MKTIEQEAKDLVDRFRVHARPLSSGFLVPNEDVTLKSAKQCALICVDEILKELNRDGIVMQSTINRRDHYTQLKKAIQKL